MDPLPAFSGDQVEEDPALPCPTCDYDLRGQVEPRCPECGLQFSSIEELATAARSAARLYNKTLQSRIRLAWAFAWAFIANIVSAILAVPLAMLFHSELAILMIVGAAALALPAVSLFAFSLLIRVIVKRFDPRIARHQRRELTGSIPVLLVFSLPFLLSAILGITLLVT